MTRILPRDLASERDQDSKTYLSSLDDRERTKANRIPGVQKVLVILSSHGMVYDIESLRQKVLQAYPEAAVFFRTTAGYPMGVESPKQVDLLIDFTGPGQHAPWFYPLKLKKMSRLIVGRNAGVFRERVYERIFDEKAIRDKLPKDTLARERIVQKAVLALAGIAMVPMGNATPDRGKEIALDLPPLART